MKRSHVFFSTAIAVVAGSAVALIGATAASASPSASPSPSASASLGDVMLSSKTIPAGGTVIVSSPGWGDLGGLTAPMTVINFETPAPPASTPTGPVGSGGNMGSNGGTSLAKETFPATSGPWTHALTIPADTPPGDGYTVCLSLQASDGMGDGGCATLTVTAASSSIVLTSSTAVAGGALSFSTTGFTAGEQVQVWVHSTPVMVDTVTANAQGMVSQTVVLPTDLPLGAHTLELKGVSSGLDLSASFTVGGVPSAATDVVDGGAASDPLRANLGWVALIALAAAGASVWTLRRRAAAE